MKKEKIGLKKKLFLNKDVIADLNLMQQVTGGDGPDTRNQCMPGSSVGNVPCDQHYETLNLTNCPPPPFSGKAGGFCGTMTIVEGCVGGVHQ